jgi:hypothetical protein
MSNAPSDGASKHLERFDFGRTKPIFARKIKADLLS